MKHFLRILIVLAICVGLFFIVRLFVKDNTPYNAYEDYNNMHTSIQTLQTKIGQISVPGSSANKFYEINTIYNFNKNSFELNLKNIQLMDLNNAETQNLKTLKNELSKELNKMNNKVDSIINYTSQNNYNVNYLNDMIDDANNQFIVLNKKFTSICLCMQSLLNSKIYDGKCYILTDTLNYNLLYMNMAYFNLDTQNGFNCINLAITKFESILNSGSATTNEGASFMINFYSLNADFVSLYENYFQNSVSTDSNFNMIVDYATKGE